MNIAMVRDVHLAPGKQNDANTAEVLTAPRDEAKALAVLHGYRSLGSGRPTSLATGSGTVPSSDPATTRAPS